MKKFVATLTALAALSAGAAQLKVFPTVIDTSSGRASVNVVNESADTITLEAHGIKIDAAGELAIFPPVASIPPGAKQVFRLIAPAAGASTQHWRAHIGEVGKRSLNETAGSAVRSELQFDVPVFTNQMGAQFSLVREGDQIVNRGNRQASITRVNGRDAQIYLMPGASVQIPRGAVLESVGNVLAVTGE